MTLRSLSRSSCALAAGLALTAVGCSDPKPEAAKSAQRPAKAGPVVAKVGNEVITAEEVRAKLAEQSPFLQARYRDLTHKKEFVQNLVRFEVLAQEAYRRGLDKTPEVEATIKKVLVQELIRQAFDEKNASFTDDDLKAYYDKHVDEFVKPERVRASQIFLKGAATDKAARAKAKTLAGQLLQQIKANEVKAPATHAQHATYSTTLFADLARKNSEDPATQATGGDLRYLSRDDLGKQYSAALADAVFVLQQPLEITGIVETPAGFHIARLTNRQLAVNRTFEDPQVRETIKGRLFREQKTKSFDDYVAKLKTDSMVSIDEAVLATVEVPNAASAPTGMPPAASHLTVPPTPPPAPNPQ